MKEPPVLWPDRIAALAVVLKGGVGAELGVRKGDFCGHLLKSTKPRKMYFVDIWKHQPRKSYPFNVRDYSDRQKKFYNHVLKQYAEQIKRGQVVILKMWTHEALALLPDHELDWVYIDADHQFAPCLRDLMGSYPKVKPGGFIMGHDYFKRRHFGVISAVERFLAEHPDMEFVGISGDRYSSFVLQKRA